MYTGPKKHNNAAGDGENDIHVFNPINVETWCI